MGQPISTGIPDDSRIVAAVTSGVSQSPARQVIVGLYWTAVEGPGGVGLAATPSRADGARTTAQKGSYAGRPLSDLAQLGRSGNPYERAIGLAAANAHWNQESPTLTDSDGLFTAGRRPVVVGRFPDLDQKLPGAIVLERNPGPNDRPASDAGIIIPTCDALIVTATTLVNGTIYGLLDLAPPDAEVTLVGPGTPLCPLLFHHGFTRLAGLVVTDRERALRGVQEGAGARHLKACGRAVVLQAGAPSP